jgi:ferrous iron transport protein A
MVSFMGINMEEKKMMLSNSEIGKHYKMINVETLGRNIRNRLCDMGLIGCNFLVIVNGRGPILMEVRGTRLAIGHGMASKIGVEEINEHS